MSELLFLQPVFKEAVWGGRKLRESFGYDIPSDATGECWAVSAHANGDCRIFSGTWKGKPLSELWKNQPELFGNEEGRMGKEFPLLVKIIDAKSDLSIQVHPDDVYAGVHESGSLGKTECWYVLDCDPGTTIVIGHHAKSREEAARMIREKRWEAFIREIPVKKGDFFQINPGCIHAIKGGILILETQQSSDITYRVYDYDRVWNGSKRALHIEQSLDVITAPFAPEEEQRSCTRTEDVDLEHLETCKFYTVEKYDIHGTWNHVFPGAFTNVSVLEGSGAIDGCEISRGMHFIIPSGYGNCRMQGRFSILCSWAPDKK